MLTNNKKNINNKGFVPLLLLLFPLTTYALSVSEIFGFLKNSTVTDKQGSIRQESLQSLKVFEPNKVFAQSEQPQSIKKEIVKEDTTSFEVETGIVDDLSGDTSENHGENAVYTVQKGDSIYSIASYFGVSVQTIMTFNHMPTITVHVGDILEIPSISGVLYEVKKGDTLAKISTKYSVDADDISLYNGLISSDDLAVGDEIFLPGAKEIKEANTVTKLIKKVTGKNVLSYKPSTWAKGDTSHLNKVSDINKYSQLPKYEGYYTFPAPGASRTQKMHGHNGVDLGAKIGTPVLASAGGVVKVAKTSGYNFGYGNYIIVSHANGTETIYGHLSRVDIAVGQSVGRGEQIGAVGSTGNSTGPHLHFEIRGAYNPWAW